MTHNIAKIRAALEQATGGRPSNIAAAQAALAALAELEKASAPQFVAGEVTKEMCWNVFEDCDGCEKNMAETARHWLDRWRKELGPALGLVEIREPTPEECARICNDALEQSDDVNADALGRTMFDAVSKWLKGEL